MQSNNLYFEPLTTVPADNFFAIITTLSLLAFIEPKNPLTLEELKATHSIRENSSVNLITPSEQWFNMATYLKDGAATAIGLFEATSYGSWGEIAYLLDDAWWGRELGFEAMEWWHKYLEIAEPGLEWWATVYPENQRSIGLLKRLGYEEVDSTRRSQLQSYDLGDRCFVRSVKVS